MYKKYTILMELANNGNFNNNRIIINNSNSHNNLMKINNKPGIIGWTGAVKIFIKILS